MFVKFNSSELKPASPSCQTLLLLEVMFWVASDLTRQDLVFFTPHISDLKETDSDRYTTCEDSFSERRAKIRVVAANVEWADHDRGSGPAGSCRQVHGMAIRKTARDDAIMALSVKPAKRKTDPKERSENQRLQAEVERLQSTVIEQAVELAVLRGKSAWG